MGEGGAGQGNGEVQGEGEDEDGEGLNIRVNVEMAKEVCGGEGYESDDEGGKSEEGEGMVFLLRWVKVEVTRVKDVLKMMKSK